MEEHLGLISGKSLHVRDQLKHVAKHHVDSFNYAIDTLLPRLPDRLPEVHLVTPENAVVRPFERMSFKFLRFVLDKPRVQTKGTLSYENYQSNTLLPVECRQRQLTYCAELQAEIARSVDGGAYEQATVKLGELPIMIGSSHCHLSGLSPEQLVASRQDASEFGGFFLINGIERIIRMLISPKRNYPIAFSRGGFTKRGFTPQAVQMRCVRHHDSFAQTITMHYLSDGSLMLRLLLYKAEYLIPLGVVLKALGGVGYQQVEGDNFAGRLTDKEIFKRIVTPSVDLQDSSYLVELADKVESMLVDARALGLKTSAECRAYLGKHFKVLMGHLEGQGLNDQQLGAAFLAERICVHTSGFEDKLNTLCLMAQKLYAFVGGRVGADNLDALSAQQCLLSGHVYFMLMRERLEEMLLSIRSRYLKDLRAEKDKPGEEKKWSEAKKTATLDKIRSMVYLRQLTEIQGKIFGKKMEYFLATGNLVSRSNLDLQQSAGFTVVADKLNATRYLSHFRSLHRGHYFTQMKTTTVRKLLPESWGFVCPVHTPDGAPCGLLNHISMACYPVANEFSPDSHYTKTAKLFDKQANSIPEGRTEMQFCTSVDQFRELINYLISTPLQINSVEPGATQITIPICLDGVLICYIPANQGPSLVGALRALKTVDMATLQPGSRSLMLPPTIEIAYLPMPINLSHKAGLYPGIFLSSGVGRFARPVRNLSTGSVEWIGPLEQIFMEIAVQQEDLRQGVTHQELNAQVILSIIAGCTPFSDHNQSPRNMYQCQMAKQTMGTPSHNMRYRADNKTYRLMTPQLPIVQTRQHASWQFGSYPSGTNAVVAVISYTGYDMEDAMIVNKSAYERGLAHGCVYKTATKCLNQEREGSSSKQFQPINSPDRVREMQVALQRAGAKPDALDDDGLPKIGTILSANTPELALFDTLHSKVVLHMYKDKEEAVVEDVKVSETDKQDRQVQLKLRVRRNPVIGDKFSSRHGQKGVLGMLWPHQDMPFTAQGIVPDILINPHAFPSRMTIGMLIESIAAKSGALNGEFQEFSTFDRYEDDSAVQHFGRELCARGFERHGNQEMYCGTTGELMKAEIFIGVVYYQRLRHMVNDKAQARATGPVDILTRQPVKGRKHHGGIRFGEMERDALLAHGVSACLHDRLMICSDYSEGWVCERCGSLLSAWQQVRVTQEQRLVGSERNIEQRVECRVCEDKGRCVKVRVPFVLRYLANELYAMNVKMIFHTK